MHATTSHCVPRVGAPHDVAHDVLEETARRAGLALRVKGDVQGVGYRRWVDCLADEMGLGADATNEDDGTVTVQAVGPADRATVNSSLAIEGPQWATPTLHCAVPTDLSI